MIKYIFLLMILMCNLSIFEQVQADTIKTIDPYDEIVWEVKTPGQIYDVAYHPNGKYVFAACGTVIHQRDAKDGSFIKQYWSGNSGNVFTDIDLSKDGKLITGCGAFNYIPVFNVESGKEIIRLNDNLFNFTDYRSVSFSPDGKKLVVTAGEDFYGSGVLLFDLNTGKRLGAQFNQTYPPKYDNNEFKSFRNAVYSNDGSYIIAASEMRKIVVKLDGNDLKSLDTLILRDYSNFHYGMNVVIKIDENQEFCFLNGFSNIGLFYNLKLKKIDTIKSQYILPSNLFYSKNNKYIIINEGDSKGDGLRTYTFNPLEIINPKYIYKTSTNFFSLFSNDSLIIASYSDKLKLLKAKWESPSYVNNESQNILPIYPNPSKESFTIPLNCSELGSEVKVISSSGKLVYDKQFENNIEESLNIDCSKWANGAYFIQVICNNQTKNYKVVIE